jgi:hypothetical protein
MFRRMRLKGDDDDDDDRYVRKDTEGSNRGLI